MEDMTVVFFYVDEKGSGRKRLEKKRFGGWKWSKEWQYDVHCEKRKIGNGSLKIFCVGLPFWEKDKKWTNSSLQQYLNGLPVPPEGRYVYYAPDRKAQKMLGRGREPINIEWILLLIEYYTLKFDSLVLVQDREMEAEELIRCFAAEIPYLGVVEDFISDWETVEDGLSMEYGLTIDAQKDFRMLHIKGKKVLVVLGAGTKLPANAVIPRGSIILSTEGRRRHGEWQEFKEKNIRYVDIENFLRDTVLDTAHKIKYNSTR